MSDPLLDISNLTLEFDIYGKDGGGARRFASRFGLAPPARPRLLKALDDVSLTVRRGERIAIMGHNGAGKSSLLKIIAGVYPIEKGRLVLKGSIAPLIELGAGFNPNLSARKNIILNGAMFGYSRREMIGKTPEILEFAGLNDFADVPLRNYSTGMRRRLAFTIATDMRPDLLIIDEIFAGGDLEFVGRARARMCDLMGSANALLMVSHNLRLLEQFCERGIWLHQGRIRADGPVEEITSAYRASVPLSLVVPEARAGASHSSANQFDRRDEYLSDEPDFEEETPFVLDPNDALHLRFPPVCWESVKRCHCQGALLPGPHLGWHICRRCRSWVNVSRLSSAAATSLHRHDLATAGIYPPGVSRLIAQTPTLDPAPVLSPLEDWLMRLGERAVIAQIGCGDGRFLEHLKRAGAVVHGYEHSPRLAALARERLSCNVRCGGTELLGERTYDAVLCIDYLSRMRDPHTALERLQRALRSEGRVLLCEPMHDDPTVPLRYEAALLCRLLYNHLLSRGALSTLAHAAGFVDVSERGTWNGWPILILK